MNLNPVSKFISRQPTYKSSKEYFELKTDNIFGIADEIHRYCDAEITGRFYHGIPIEGQRPLAYTVGMGRRLEIVAPKKDLMQSNGSNIVNLGDLVLSEDGRKLTIQIHPHNGLLINPQGLVDIVRNYQVSKES